MLKPIVKQIKRWEKALNKSYQHPIVTARDRRRAVFFARWIDHGVLRAAWHNFDTVAPGVYRSNHPSPARVAALPGRGIRSLINLRGDADLPTSLLSAEAAEAYGLTVINVRMSARKAPRIERINMLLDVFETLEPPFLIHCKSGADRTGLAAAIYLSEVAGLPPAEARAQLSTRYLHLRWSRTGVLDMFYDRYAAAHAETGIRLRDWVNGGYCPDALQRDFNATPLLRR